MKKTLIALIAYVVLLANAKAQTLNYKVYVLRFARSAYHFTVADWAQGGPKTPVNINFMFWLIKAGNENILVDAGFLNDLPDTKDFMLKDYVRPDAALKNFGIKATDITDIIITHPHWDHIDGVSLFPNAHIWIQKDDYNGLINNFKKKKPEDGFEKRDADKMAALKASGKVTLVDGDNKQLMPGITVYTGSKHTFNSQYVLVSTPERRIVIASDNIWIYYSLDHMVPAVSAGTLDPAGYVKAMQRMKTLASNPKYILPGHDAAVFTKFPQVKNGVAEVR